MIISYLFANDFESYKQPIVIILIDVITEWKSIVHHFLVYGYASESLSITDNKAYWTIC